MHSNNSRKNKKPILEVDIGGLKKNPSEMSPIKISTPEMQKSFPKFQNQHK